MSISPIEVQKHLKGVDYPANGEDLAETAEEQEAPEELVTSLRSLGDETFEGPSGVMEAISGELGSDDE